MFAGGASEPSAFQGGRGIRGVGKTLTKGFSGEKSAYGRPITTEKNFKNAKTR